MTKANLRRFEGKVAFVTGGASGIGKATALAFASEGAHVAICDISHKAGEAALAEIKRLSPRSIFLPCDVSSHESVRAAISLTVRRFDRLDCAFNNAGIEGKTAMLVDIDETDFDLIIDVNLKGVWLCMKYELAQMWQQGFGSIVNCSSVAGLVGFSQSSAYIASKHGVVGLTKGAALEVARAKIRVNAVCPGVIQTPMIDRAVAGNPDMKAHLVAGEPLGRFGTPEEIADAVLWLCSDGASFVTGQAIAIDGGWVAQ
jgi:NAD(P)-dependent dehydrogenase (short-subunit alcohol dehydrogenase family)